MTSFNTIKKTMRSRMTVDVIWLSAIFLLSFAISASFDLLEWLLETVKQYESIELDEFLSVSIISSFLFAVFSYRRWQDVRQLSLYFEELSMLDPITMLPNKRVITRILHDIKKGTNKKCQFPLSLLLIDISGLETIRSQLGHHIAEKTMHELVYRYSLLLSEEQLISYRSTNQCLVFCPKLDRAEAALLQEKISNIEVNNRQTTLQLLAINVVSVTLYHADDIDSAFEQLDDNLQHFALSKIA